MLVVRCEEHLAKVREFASKMGLLDQLERQLAYLASYSSLEDEPEGTPTRHTRCNLYSDFAPWSFSGNLEIITNRDGLPCEPKYWFAFGLIYQGPDCPADGSFPSLTVSLASGTGWFVHT
jgi:hypothetical protein